MPISGERGGDGRRIKPEKAGSAKAEPAESKPRYVGGKIVRDDDGDDWTGVRDHRVQSRNDLTDAIAAKGGTQKTYPIATNRLNDKMFRSGRPDGKLDSWSKEDQQRITVGNKIAKQYIEDGDDGHYGIITSIERGGADANARCNEDGVEPWWRRLVGYDWQEEMQREEKKAVVERAQTKAEVEDDSHLTEGQKQLKRHRAQQAQEEKSGGGFFGGFFSGKDLWEESADRARALEAEEQYVAASKHSEPTDAEEESGILGKIWHWATHE